MLSGYRLRRRVRDKTFSLGVAGAFAGFGARSTLELPVRLGGERRMSIGDDVFVGAGSWLQVLDRARSDGVALSIGGGTSIAGGCVLSAALSVVLERRVLLARNVYISDHVHGFEDTSRAVLDQGITRVAAVRVCEGAWLGENVVVCPGVTIGRGAVIGANAVVTADVPEHAVAVGAPARVIRSFAPTLEAVS